MKKDGEWEPRTSPGLPLVVDVSDAIRELLTERLDELDAQNDS
jgi:hypothetical protein